MNMREGVGEVKWTKRRLCSTMRKEGGERGEVEKERQREKLMKVRDREREMVQCKLSGTYCRRLWSLPRVSETWSFQ